jgi:hypothetical protein
MTTTGLGGSAHNPARVLLACGLLAPLTYATLPVILAVNPFVLLSLVLGAAAFQNGFRQYSIATIVILVVMAVIAFSYVPAVNANQLTPWLGSRSGVGQFENR